MGSLPYQKGRAYCGARVRMRRAAVRYLSKLDRDDSMLFSKGTISHESLLNREGSVLAASSCSSSLSCCRRSFAHLANSSWLLVAFSSPRTFKYSACSFLCCAAVFDVEIGRTLTAVHS